MPNASPLSESLVTIFGGGGFLGRYVAQSLLSRGARVRIACRDADHAHALQPLADLGQLQYAPCDVTHEESVAAALYGASHAVNLVGTFGSDMEAVMGQAPGTIGRLAREAGLSGLVHISAIGADVGAATNYASAKGQGEAALQEAFPQATILRPSIIFAKDDSFINMFAGLIELMPAVPVFGPDAQLQVVLADDVAEAVAVALEQPAEHGGHIYELGGPEVLSMMELHQRIAATQGRESRRLLAMPDSASALFASLPLTPMSRDQWKLLKAGSVVSGEHRSFAELGIAPHALGQFLDKWMVQYRQFGRFGAANERVKSFAKEGL